MKTFVRDSAGIKELLRSAGMADMISGHASRVRSSADSMDGTAHESEVRVGRGRAVGYVRVADGESYRSNLRSNTLLKALGGGR
jgi:hypothetical protein